MPWTREKALTWDFTLPDTFAQSHVDDTAILAGAAANHGIKSAQRKDIQVLTSDRHQHFCASWERTGGAWNIQAIEFINELDKHITTVTNEPMETKYIHFHTTG